MIYYEQRILLCILLKVMRRNLFFDELMPSEYDYDDGDIAFLRKTVLQTVFPLVPCNIKSDDNNIKTFFFLQHVLVMQYYNGITF